MTGNLDFANSLATLRELPSNLQVAPRIILEDWERAIRNGFQPSKLRHVPAILNTTAAGAQRSGGALPSFLPRGVTPTQALELARLIDPFGRALELSLSNRDKSNFWRITQEPKAVKTGRNNVIRELTKIAITLQPAQERIRGVLDTTAPAQALRIPLITFLVKKFKYPDTTLARDIARGMQITGTIAKSNSLATRITPSAKLFQHIRGGLAKRNRNILRAIRSTANRTLKQKCWEISWLEHTKGWLTKPVPVTRHGEHSHVPSILQSRTTWLTGA